MWLVLTIKEIKLPTADASSEYSKIVKKFLDNGDWEDAVKKLSCLEGMLFIC